jgi:signal transduction histidine kinase
VRLEDRQIGAVLAGDKLDDAYAERVGHSAQMQVAFFAGDRLAASSLRGKARGDLARLGDRPTHDQLKLNGEPFLAREVSLGASAHAAVLVSEEFMLRPLAEIRRAILAVSALALLLALLLTLALARGLSSPVGELVEMASAIGRHDLGARVVPSGGRELAVLGQTMNEMVVELGQQRRRDELAGFLVHDLKGPLAAVLGNAEFLLDPRAAPAESVIEATRDIVDAAETMLRMVMDLLDVGKSADGQLAPRKVPIEMASFLEEIQQRAQSRAGMKSQKVVLDPGAPLSLSADRELLRRVIDNLLDNCFKYSPAEGTITLGWRTEGTSAVVIRVRDEGPGVPADLRERIFDKYFQLDRDLAQHTRTSRGMGLVFCKAAVEAHAGQIWVEDNQPKGSVFGVRLPG